MFKECFMIYTIVVFIVAGLAEIGGGYLIWLCLREGKPLYLGIFGGIAIVWFCCKVRKNITNYHFNMVVFP